MRLLVDGDMLAFRFSIADEEVVDWGEIVSWWADPDRILGNITSFISDLVDRLGGTSVLLAFSAPRVWRSKLYPEYKMNRSEARKPLALVRVKQALVERFESVELPGLEADDVLGIEATKPGSNSIIIAQDKDMRSVPARLYNPFADDPEIEEIDDLSAFRHHMFQTLVGDRADNYPGCPGIGPKKAEKILRECETPEEMWGAVVTAFEGAGLGADDALLQARIAKILTFGMYKEGKVKLWRPPCPKA